MYSAEQLPRCDLLRLPFASGVRLVGLTGPPASRRGGRRRSAGAPARESDSARARATRSVTAGSPRLAGPRLPRGRARPTDRRAPPALSADSSVRPRALSGACGGRSGRRIFFFIFFTSPADRGNPSFDAARRPGGPPPGRPAADQSLGRGGIPRVRPPRSRRLGRGPAAGVAAARATRRTLTPAARAVGCWLATRVPVRSTEVNVVRPRASAGGRRKLATTVRLFANYFQ